MKLELFQTTVREYKRFIKELPLDYPKATTGDFSDTTYVAANTRLMLLRKYTRNGRGSLHLTDVVNEAICHFPTHLEYLSEFQKRFQLSCEQSLNHRLADGTERTLDESIDDTMYGLHLHADEERVLRIAQDNELLRQYCVVTFVKEIEALVMELSDFLEVNSVPCIEKSLHERAPVIHLDSNESASQKVTGAPYWGNLIGSDMTEENAVSVITNMIEHYTYEECQLWVTAGAFTNALSREILSYDELKRLVYEPNISDWGDFSEAAANYKTIPAPGMSTVIRYNDKRDVAYIHVYPRVEAGFIVNTPQLISDVYVMTLVKDEYLCEWRVFAFGGRIDPHLS